MAKITAIVLALFLASFFIHSSALAVRDLPEFEALDQTWMRTSVNGADLKSSEVLKTGASVKKFRVLVFPHWGQYSTPQGKESAAESVTVTTNGDCIASSAKLDSTHEWSAGPATLNRASRFVLDAKTMTPNEAGALYYACSQPFKVLRAAPLKSFEYSGDFVAVSDGKKISVINIVDGETYLKGVIPSEVEASWPMEVLKAQAVAGRTYAWFSILVSRFLLEDKTKHTEVRSPLYDMDDTVMYQAYSGNSQRTAQTDKAADDTARLVMKFNGQIVKAYFSGDSGGYSESASSVFGADLLYCRAHKESYDVSLSKTDWKKDLPVNQLHSFFGSDIVSMRVSKRNESGRVEEMIFVDTAGQFHAMPGTDFRFATQMRSTLFEVSVHDGIASFTGRGWGHGVGMAQVGALQYSKQMNWSFDQILKFYYNGITLTTE